MDSILIIGHGSPGDEKDSAAAKHAKRLSEILGKDVRYAFLHANPEVDVVLKGIAADAPDRLIVLPFFMAPGMYTEKVVPGIFGLEKGAREGEFDLGGKKVKVLIAPAFGSDSDMGRIVCGCVERHARKGRSTAVVLIGHGSPDGTSSGNIKRIAEDVRQQGYRVFTGSNEMEHPDVQEALQQAIESVAETIVVIPMFTSGSHHSRVEIPEKLGLPAGKSERRIQYLDGITTVVYTQEIGLEDGIADIFAGQCRVLGVQ